MKQTFVILIVALLCGCGKSSSGDVKLIPFTARDYSYVVEYKDSFPVDSEDYRWSRFPHDSIYFLIENGFDNDSVFLASNSGDYVAFCATTEPSSGFVDYLSFHRNYGLNKFYLSVNQCRGVYFDVHNDDICIITISKDDDLIRVFFRNRILRYD